MRAEQLNHGHYNIHHTLRWCNVLPSVYVWERDMAKTIYKYFTVLCAIEINGNLL